MKKIKLIPVEVEDEFDDYEDMGVQEGKHWNFELDLPPYVIACAIACGILFVMRFIKKHFFQK